MRHLLASVAVELARLCLWLALLAAIFVLLERSFALRPAKILRRGWGADLIYFFLSGILPSLLLAAPLGSIAWVAHRVIPGGLLAPIAQAPVWARLTAAFVIGETGFYWGHRWSHEIPLLWRFHAIHHSAEQIDWLVNTRAHPVDLVFGRLCGLIPLYVLNLAGPTTPAGSAAPVLLIVLGTIWGFFIHANLRWRFGWLEQVVATPAFHHWHHTIDAGRDRNYAAMLPVLDRLFGTLHLPRHRWPAEYGIDQPVPASLSGQLLAPLMPRR